MQNRKVEAEARDREIPSPVPSEFDTSVDSSVASSHRTSRGGSSSGSASSEIECPKVDVPSFRLLGRFANDGFSSPTSEGSHGPETDTGDAHFQQRALHELEVVLPTQKRKSGGFSDVWRVARDQYEANPAKTTALVLFGLLALACIVFLAVASSILLRQNRAAVAATEVQVTAPPALFTPSRPESAPISTPTASVASPTVSPEGHYLFPPVAAPVFSPSIPAPTGSREPASSSMIPPIFDDSRFVSSLSPTRILLDPNAFKGGPTVVQYDGNGCVKHPDPVPLPGKKGAVFTFREEGERGSWIENLPKVESLDAYWNYNWGPRRIDAQPEELEFAPMTWGKKNVALFLEEHILPQIEAGTVRRILGFNEPDKAKQASMTVEEAIDLWSLLEDTGVSLVSPSCGNPTGEWMEEFMESAAKLCYRVDWIGVHWYGGISVAGFKSRMRAIYEKYGKPLLVTEFAPADWNADTVLDNRHTPQEVLSFAQGVLPWMEETPWIVGYAWFSFSMDRAEGTSSALFDLDGEITALGLYYKSVRTDNPSGDQDITA